MQKAAVVLGVLRERGERKLPCAQLYRQMFNKDLYLTAYGNIYSNQGAMTPGAGEETADPKQSEISPSTNQVVPVHVLWMSRSAVWHPRFFRNPWDHLENRGS